MSCTPFPFYIMIGVCFVSFITAVVFNYKYERGCDELLKGDCRVQDENLNICLNATGICLQQCNDMVECWDETRPYAMVSSLIMMILVCLLCLPTLYAHNKQTGACTPNCEQPRCPSLFYTRQQGAEDTCSTIDNSLKIAGTGSRRFFTCGRR